jgi:hypothetical protein
MGGPSGSYHYPVDGVQRLKREIEKCFSCMVIRAGAFLRGKQKLFIANTTKQRHIFTFRQLETGRLARFPLSTDRRCKFWMARPKKSKQLFSIIRFMAWLTQPKSTRARRLSACAASTNQFPPALLRKHSR